MVATLNNQVPAFQVRPGRKGQSFLDACNCVYESMVGLLGRMNPSRDPEGVLQCIHRIAHFAWRSHTGRYADGALENLALKIGANLECLGNRKKLGIRFPAMPPRRRDRHVLHVATALFPVGGHTRLLLNWIRTDARNQHSVLLTAQNQHPIPTGVTEAVREAGGGIVVLPPGASLMAKALWARDCARRDVDFVVLHHHPDDPVPTVAYATPISPPVAVLNHADHVFWLGSGVADAVLNCRDSGKELSEGRRFTRHNFFLPLPLSPAPVQVSREAARAALSIPDSQVVFLSVGEAYKYRPTPTHDFFRTASAILEQNPDAHLYLIGLEANEVKEYTRGHVHPRIHPLGIKNDPTQYQAAADIYLEGFPFSSPTALMEAAQRGVPCVGALAPHSPLLAADDIAFSGLLANPSTEAAYVQDVTRLVRDPEERARLGGCLRQRIERHHCSDGWLSRLDQIYGALEALVHSPTRIPHAPFQATEDDLALSSMQGVHCDLARLFERTRVEFKYFLPAGLIPVIRFSLRFREAAWGQLHAKLWRRLLKDWMLYKLGRPLYF